MIYMRETLFQLPEEILFRGFRKPVQPVKQIYSIITVKRAQLKGGGVPALHYSKSICMYNQNAIVFAQLSAMEDPRQLVFHLWRADDIS